MKQFGGKDSVLTILKATDTNSKSEVRMSCYSVRWITTPPYNLRIKRIELWGCGGKGKH